MKTSLRIINLFLGISVVAFSMEASAFDAKERDVNDSCKKISAWVERECFFQSEGDNLAVCSKMSRDVFATCLREQGRATKNDDNDKRTK